MEADARSVFASENNDEGMDAVSAVVDTEVAARLKKMAVWFVRRSWTSRISSTRQMLVKGSLPKTAIQQQQCVQTVCAGPAEAP